MPDLKTASLTGSAGGRPFTSAPLDPDVLVEQTALALLAGKTSPKMHGGIAGHISADDHRTLARLCQGMTVEEFGNRVQGRLRVLADRTADRLEEKLEQDAIEPGNLGYLLSVVLEKLARYEGRVMTAQTNVQVNHYHGIGEKSRDDILASIRGNSPDVAI